ncbi:MAG TPA: M14 family metallopeptidase, partial [Candidatus Edwardsbacteria bacterium]|nr:M14 family metallopeptidase [Candidatus Edwardsbacteria bacterium]
MLALVLSLLLVSPGAFAVVQRVVISVPQPQQLRALAADGRLDILRVTRGRDVECFADDKVVAEYQAQGCAVTVKLADAPAYYRQLMARMRGGKYAFGPYYTYPVANQKMDSLHLLYPSLVAAKESLGVTRLGKKIYGFSLTAAAAGKPGVLYTGQHHAREPFGCNNAIEFARYLGQHYGTDSLVTFLVNNRQFWFIPIVNVDGSIYNSDTSADGMWRKNRRNNGDGTIGVDLNRNYPYRWGYDNVGSSPTSSDETYRGPSAGSEPEVQAEMNLMASKGFFRTALNYHTYSNLWVLPWSWSDSYPADSAAIVDLAIEATSYNGFTWGTPSQTVGYTVNGDANDWSLQTESKAWKCLGMTPEVGGSDFYEPDSVQLELASNLIPNLLVAEAAGVYLDARTTAISGGNGNSALDPGETANLALTLKNEAVFDTARNVSTTISSADPYVTINTPTAAYGDLTNRQAKANGGTPFVVTLDAGCPVGHRVLFWARITADSGYVSSDSFSVTAGVGDLHYQPTPDNSAGSPLYYAVEDSDAASRAPAYSWAEIRGIGTRLLGGDDSTKTVTLPFTFRWYGTGYTTLSACSNGWI